MKPMFIVLDGIDGVGKSTQIQRLESHLHGCGQQVVCVQDPGGTSVGSELRRLLLDTDLEMHRRTEAMLFMASRSELIEQVIRPALTAGKTVLSDRFLLANVVYQSIGGQVSAESLWELGRLAADHLEPDLTLLLDMPAGESAKRMQGAADRMERRGEGYLESVRQAFLEQLPRSSPQTAVIDAGGDVDDVTQSIIAAVEQLSSH